MKAIIKQMDKILSLEEKQALILEGANAIKWMGALPQHTKTSNLSIAILFNVFPVPESKAKLFEKCIVSNSASKIGGILMTHLLSCASKSGIPQALLRKISFAQKSMREHFNTGRPLSQNPVFQKVRTSLLSLTSIMLESLIDIAWEKYLLKTGRKQQTGIFFHEDDGHGIL